ncbi:MAG: hypothetical protein JSV62_06020 [Promethearchaeota archaeon]|nr:MAG: hypothetical protein JSV62_06020 [Candidatus Lokiarchaeota archaeon]
MVESRKITIKDVFNELKWYTILFSELENPTEEHLLRMQKITKLTHGIGDLFLDNIFNKLVDCVSINYRLVLEIIFAHVKNRENPAWFFLSKPDIIRQILEEVYKFLESDEDQAIYKRILDELHAIGYDISGLPT